MTKPQFSAEPSMEDILASIRKMISEERMGPRPIPDQIGRSPFGESTAERREARSVGLEPSPDAAPAERAAPSFSSLSDALKSASPAAEQRLTLDEKIADMLETEGGAAAPRPAPSPDPLAVFSANRPSLAPSPDAGAFGPAPRSAAPERSAPERTNARQAPAAPTAREVPRAPRPVSRQPEAPLNGAAHRRDAKPAETGTVVPLSSEAPSAHRDEAAPRPTASPASPSKSAVRPAPDAEPKKTDTQRIIAMPTRHGTTAGAGPQTTASPAGPSAMNGTNVASLGPRSVSPGALASRAATILREADAAAAKAKDSDAAPDTGPVARSSDGITARSGEGTGRIKSAEGLAERLANVGQEPQPVRNEAAKAELETRVQVPSPVDARAEVTPARPRAGGEAATPAESRTEDRPATQAAEPGAARPAPRTPSDALLDAVVDLVHQEPDTLSVFTSGSAFIHGVNSHEPVSKPGPNSARKLDRSAAELLRPMLRQWLSENMPRIVEEALRSELMSSQSDPKDSDEA